MGHNNFNKIFYVSKVYDVMHIIDVAIRNDRLKAQRKVV